jgi:two-component system, OmpR family, sensor histidine kinase BaeS
MGPFALALALCSLVAGVAGGLALRLVPSLRLRLAGLALLASGLPLVAVVASGLIMFDTRHDALVTLVAAAASAAALVGALLVSRSISLPLHSLRRTARRLADGELEARAELSGPRELRDVAAVVNEMSTSLDGLLRAQRELVAAASHDLRTPLTNLRAAAEALEDGVGDPAQHVASLQVQVERMSYLVDDLLDLSRLDAGVVPLDLAETELAPLLDDCLALYAADARAAQVRLERECPPGLRGRCDPLQLGRVLANLVGNAIRHTPPGGRVVISARPGVEVSVADTGSGLPPGAGERVFERFWRGDESRAAGGTGLGLAIARAIVELHGGTIRVADAPGGGACFTFTLP